MRVAVAQIACALGDVSANIEKMRSFAEEAAGGGAELIVFPEMADTGYSMPVIREHARALEDGAVPVLRDTARQLSLAIVCGVSEREGECIYNSQVFIAPDGTLLAKYRKAHLFTPAPVAEHTCFTAGCELAAAEYRELRFGLSICYDLRFPELYRTLAVEHGADVLVNSSAWPFPRVEHLRVLAIARAIENQSYMLLANRVGTDVRVPFCGSSAIIDPYGVIVAAASADREELVVAGIKPDTIRDVRTRMPVFTDRRPELYAAANPSPLPQTASR